MTYIVNRLDGITEDTLKNLGEHLQRLSSAKSVSLSFTESVTLNKIQLLIFANRSDEIADQDLKNLCEGLQKIRSLESINIEFVG